MGNDLAAPGNRDGLSRLDPIKQLTEPVLGFEGADFPHLITV